MFDPNSFYEEEDKKFYNTVYLSREEQHSFNPFEEINEETAKKNGGMIKTFYFSTIQEQEAFRLGLVCQNCYKTVRIIDKRTESTILFRPFK